MPETMAPDSGTRIAAQFQQGQALHQLGRLADAKLIYERILEQQADHFGALHFLGVIAAQTNQPERAADLMGRSIRLNGSSAVAFNNYGNALAALRRHEAALESYDRAVMLNPDYADAWCNRGNALRQIGQPQAALESYDKAIALDHRNADAHFNRAVTLTRLERHPEALASYDRAIACDPNYAEAHSNRGLVLVQLQRPEEALASYERAIAVRPDFAAAYSNRGMVLKELGDSQGALASYTKALALQPDFAEAYSNRGIVRKALGDLDAALADYDRAIALKADYADAYNNRANALQELKQYEAALADYDKTLELVPDYPFLFGTRLYARMQMCEWNVLAVESAALEAKIERGAAAADPFCLLATLDSPALQRKAAELWVKHWYPWAGGQLRPEMRSGHRRLRVGYFSGDFREHPVSYLAVELIEAHDRSMFEVVGFSFGPDTGDRMRERLRTAFDSFIDVRGKSDREIALLARSLEIDIAVDLSGYTQHSRPGIFALRAAPLQVSYLGYLGTLGAGFMDYLIADSTIIPPASREHYDEKILYLPSYQVNDSKRPGDLKAPTREALGLPRGVVFCCFNTSYKISPRSFDSWMRILARVEGSVLWLYAHVPAVASNLRREAQARGVDADRLVFCGRVSRAEYLARYGAVDLFLDTLPYNAGTTASDALWLGVPVLTLPGEAFAARVAASLLMAAGLPELIASSPQDYEDRAVALATDPLRLAELKQRLADRRFTCALFDTPRFTRHLEAGFAAIQRRHAEGLPPEHVEGL
jgi:predicted O-linked N-acetylglucosamine transferase (SPINDLY family)